MRYIGDVHAKFDRYLGVTQNVSESIQVGDFGCGFAKMPQIGLQHKFIRGNHDNPEVAMVSKNWICDGYYNVRNDSYFIGGAFSIDQNFRIEGRDWWRNEECSYAFFMNEINRFTDGFRPRIIITHDAPASVADQLFRVDYRFPNITSRALQYIFEIHQPALYIFGHWHQNKDVIINSTRFICLDELSYIDIDFNDLHSGTIIPYKN